MVYLKEDSLSCNVFMPCSRRWQSIESHEILKYTYNKLSWCWQPARRV